MEDEISFGIKSTTNLFLRDSTFCDIKVFAEISKFVPQLSAVPMAMWRYRGSHIQNKVVIPRLETSRRNLPHTGLLGDCLKPYGSRNDEWATVKFIKQ